MGQLFTTYRTHLFIVLGVAIALGAAWWSLSEKAPSESLLTPQENQIVAENNQDLVDTLLQLRTVTLSGTIFSDPSFQGLRDFGTQIVPEPVGRPNPFAPFPGSSTSTPDAATELFAPGR